MNTNLTPLGSLVDVDIIENFGFRQIRATGLWFVTECYESNGKRTYTVSPSPVRPPTNGYRNLYDLLNTSFYEVPEDKIHVGNGVVVPLKDFDPMEILKFIPSDPDSDY